MERIDSSPAVVETLSSQEQSQNESVFSKYFKKVRIHTKIEIISVAVYSIFLSIASLAILYEKGTLKNIGVGLAIGTRSIGVAARIVRRIQIKKNVIDDNKNEKIIINAMNSMGFFFLASLLSTMAIKTNEIGMKVLLSVGIIAKIGLSLMFFKKNAKLMKEDISVPNTPV